MQTALKFFFSLMLIFSFSAISFGQTVEESDAPPVVVPEQAMEQVVRRILVWSFKPRKQKKIIYLAAQGIQKSWLPTIKNIEFRLLSDEEVRQRKEGVYFFTKPECSENEYSIVLAFGDPNCNYLGNSWYFRITNQRVRLRRPGNAAGGCGD